MTAEAKRRIIADQMGFKDTDFLKWHDGMYEAETSLIKRQRNASDPHYPDHGVWTRYVEALRELTKGTYDGSDIHASVDQKQDAFLMAMGVKI